jgi:hypothetical protein
MIFHVIHAFIADNRFAPEPLIFVTHTVEQALYTTRAILVIYKSLFFYNKPLLQSNKDIMA